MMDAKQAKQLRDPFPASAIGKLPKPTHKDNPKGNCGVCGKYHGLPAVHLDYAGHAAVTDRLLQVDPEWTWEPMAVTAEGLPATDRAGNLWIKLTIAGVTRPGVGDGSSAKECIGDAIRNAAMRFGVGLDLWAKEDLHAAGSPSEGEPQAAGADGPIPVSAPEGRSDQAPSPSEGNPPRVITKPQKDRLYAIASNRGVPKEESKRIIAEVAGVDSSLKIPVAKYDAVIDALDAWTAAA